MEVSSWGELTLQHMLYAYRKAKADCFYDRVAAASFRFSDYERDLHGNLVRLLERLRNGQIHEVLEGDARCFRVVAKKLSLEARQSEQGGHAYFSDAERAFERVLEEYEPRPEFRVIGDFSVEAHILSALWINHVGHKFDACLGKVASGSRLKRFRASSNRREGAGTYHIEAVGSFQPYFRPYRQWRQLGLKAIRDELKGERSVVALSLDLKSFYHRIDPSFLASHDFHARLGIELSDWEANLNAAFCVFLCAWSREMGAHFESQWFAEIPAYGGLPIGLAASRIVANVLLAELDRDLERELAPIYYGRYIDDIFLVFRDPGNVTSAQRVLEYIGARAKCFPSTVKGDIVELRLPGQYQGRTVLSLQPSKQKVFFLSGSAGLDLLDSIEAQIRSVASERRLMPSPDRLGAMASAKVLSAASHAAEEADTLRRAEGLSIRRLSWSLQLRAVEILARDLRQQDWADERAEFYRFARNHVLRADRILDHMDYLPRLLSLAVALEDWGEAESLISSAMSAVAALQEKSTRLVLNGMQCGLGGAVWQEFLKALNGLLGDAVFSSIQWDIATGKAHPLPTSALALCERLGMPAAQESVEALALQIREADLAKTPYRQHLAIAAMRHRPVAKDEAALTMLYRRSEGLRDFLIHCDESPGRVGLPRTSFGAGAMNFLRDSLLPYVFPTRPYSTQQISALLPDKCVFENEPHAAANWAGYAKAVRGAWADAPGNPLRHPRTRLSKTGCASDSDRLGVAYLGGDGRPPKVLLGISSIETSDASWRKAAAGTSDIGRDRYERVRSVVNQAIGAIPRPSYLLLPELSLPERWIDTVSQMLGDVGIGLVAGVDYQSGGTGAIHSSAVLTLEDTRLGYPARVEVRQVKSLPAPGEDKLLRKDFGVGWTKGLPSRKPVYIHNGFAFAVLVCSELQNAGHRLDLQGDVDCLMVLSWNQDLETFSSLVESASLDVHASIALVNNRRYGDSRVRVPSKAHHGRDLCRLRGGKNEHVVIVEVDVAGLRAFQSRATRWPEDGDPYKPVPEGFRLASYRRTIPE